MVAGYPSLVTVKDVENTTHTYTTESGRVYHFNANEYEYYLAFRRYWGF